ncbi:MAG: hypothetical protein RIM84_05825 [Alphaproteobacteria bacterium]
MLVATLAREVGGVEWASGISAAGLLVYVVLQWPALPANARWILAVATGAGLVAVPFIDDLVGTLAVSARTASYYAGFFVATGFLRMAAETSALIQRCGAHLLAQPTGRQYMALTVGTNVLGLVLSFGALQLLGTMVGRAVRGAGGGDAVRDWRQRRLSLAVLRGICMAPAWSPFSVSLAMALTVSPDADWLAVVPLAFVVALLLMLLGWLMENRRPAPQGAGPLAAAGTGTWGDQGRLLLLVLTMFAIAAALEEMLQVRLVIAVMASVPVIALIWIGWQLHENGAGRAAAILGRRLGQQVLVTFPAYRTEMAILASAGFGGSLVAAALPRQAIAAALVAADLPAAAIPIGILLAIVLGAQLALNPIITITVVAAVLPPLAAVGVSPELAAVASMLGFGLAVGGSPFMLFLLMTARLAGRAPGEVAYRWNGGYTVLAMAAVSALFVAASGAML